jgi:hypothetical protein
MMTIPMSSFSLLTRRAWCIAAAAFLALAACSGSLQTSTSDVGTDAGFSPIVDAGAGTIPDATLADGDVFVDGGVLVDASPASSDAASDTGTGSVADVDAGPEILSLSQTVSSMTQGGSFTVVAIVGDPQGLSNLAGGQLVSASGAVLGAFVAEGQGTYSLTLSWDALNASSPINFTGQASVTNRATFADVQGRTASQDLPITLYCGTGAAPDAACAGRCVDLTSLDTCGSCTTSCAVVSSFGPQDVACRSPGTCVFDLGVYGLSPDGGCAATCEIAGGTCISGEVTTQDGTAILPVPCSSLPLQSDARIATPTVVAQIGCACGSTDDNPTFFPKVQTGSCASMCASLPSSPPCTGTIIYTYGLTGSYVETDECSAPYVLGTGTEWDDLVQADLPTTVTVMSTLWDETCRCEAPAQ